MPKPLLWTTVAALLLLLGTASPWPIAMGQPAPAAPSRLADAKSPYLLNHQDNPVRWYPWGAEAFQAAQRENRPIFLSIGYSSCHWCHVMSGESFSHAEVAALLNGHFIPILVDREERPDVDYTYGKVQRAMTGVVGWPMSIFLTPGGEPFMAAGFIPRAQFLRLLRQFRDIWREEPARIQDVGRQVTAQLQEGASTGFSDSKPPGEEALRAFFSKLRTSFDPQHGGFGTPSKFLPPMELSLLLRIHRRTGNREAMRMVKLTLDAMARGGIHDHLGGGFHRYAIDPEWLVPHFEKMLPDNALTAIAYLEAHQATQNPEYAAVARGILDYLLRRLSHPQGGFYAGEDADSEKTEGKFYVWSLEEVQGALSPSEFRAFSQTYPLRKEGNFNPWLKDVEERAGIGVVKRGNILHLPPGSRWPDAKEKLLAGSRHKLLQLRASRPRPHRDEKIVTGWNGLAIWAMAKGYQVLGEAHYLKAAQQAARFLLAASQMPDGALLRHWFRGATGQRAFLPDYAFLVRGLLVLYQSDFDRLWLETALKLQAAQDRLFWDDQGGGYFFSEAGGIPPLPREKRFVDDALPSGNAVAALNLLQLGDLTLRSQPRKMAARLLSAAAPQIRQGAAQRPQLLAGVDYLSDKSKEVAVIGPLGNPATQAALRFLHGEFLPNAVLAAGPPTPMGADETATVPLLYAKPMLEGKTTIYVCENNLCRLPTSELSTVAKLVREIRKYTLEPKF